MTTREQLLQYASGRKEREGVFPIYQISLFEHPNKAEVYPSGKKSGFPDLGAANDMGFYYDLDDAIWAMNHNDADIQEHCYHAGFILCKFPGLYQAVGRDLRMYFVWDEEKEGFFQQEEPAIFAHLAY